MIETGIFAKIQAMQQERKAMANRVDVMRGIVVLGLPLNKKATRLKLMGNIFQNNTIVHSFVVKNGDEMHSWRYLEGGAIDEQLSVVAINAKGIREEAEFFCDDTVVYASAELRGTKSFPVDLGAPKEKDYEVLQKVADLLTPYLDAHPSDA